MAVFIKPSPMNELAKLIGEAAGSGARIYQDEKNIRSLSDVYSDKFGYSKEQARAIARNPTQALALMKFEAAKEKAMSAEDQETRKKQQAIDLLLSAKKANNIRKASGKISRAFGSSRIGKIFGGNASEQEINSRIDSLKKNELIKDLDIALPSGEDDPDISDALFDEALFKLGYKGEERKVAQDETDLAERDLDSQDVAAKAAPGLMPNAPVDDIEQDEIMDPAAMQMQQQMGTRTPVGQQMPQGTSMEGIGDQALNLGKSALSGLYSGVTLPAQALEAARGYFNPEQPSQQQMEDQAMRDARQRQAMGLAPAPEKDARLREALRTPIKGLKREDAYKFLGGKEEQDLFAKSANEFVGDVTEQLPLAAVTGAFGALSNVPKALQYIGITQGAGNLAKWLSKEAGESEGFANTVKLGATLLTAYGLGPTLKSVAQSTETAAENSIPEFARASAKNDGQIKDAAWELNQVLSKTKNGYSGELDKLRSLTNSSQRILYRDALDAVQDVRFGDYKLSEEAKDAVKIFYDGLSKDMLANSEIPEASKKLFRNAKELMNNYNKSEEAVSFLAQIPRVKTAVKNEGLTGLLGLGLLSTYSMPAATIGAGALAGKKVWDFGKGMHQFATSEAMRDYYLKMMNAAVQKDGVQAAKYLFDLNKVAEQKNKKKR